MCRSDGSLQFYSVVNVIETLFNEWLTAGADIGRWLVLLVTPSPPPPVPFLRTFLFQFNQLWQLIVPERRTLYFSSSDRQYNINCTIFTIDELNIECPEKRCVLSIFMTCSPLRPLRFCRIVLQNAGNAMSGSLEYTPYKLLARIRCSPVPPSYNI